MYNPAAQIKTAWSTTNSPFGKVAVVLLYLFIWMQLIWGVALIVNPRLGFECAYQDVSDATGDYMDNLMVGLNVFSFGYFLFAHYYGILLWNVLAFALLGGATVANNYLAASDLRALGGQDECAETIGEGLMTQNVVFSIIVVAMVLCSLVDWAKGRGEADSPSTVCLLNPLSQIRAAWDATASVFGKLSAVLLYLLVWMEVVGNATMIIDPSNGNDFAYDGAPDLAVIFMRSLTIGGALFAISYLAYVHYHGVKLWNVLTFAAVAVSVITNNAVLVGRLGAAAEEETSTFAADKRAECAFLSALVGLMSVGAALDARAAGKASTAGENAPLYEEEVP